MTRPAIAFTGSLLDRADHIRCDPAALAARMDWRARLLRLIGLDPPITAEGRIGWTTLADADPASDLVFLGIDGEGHACFVEVPADHVGSAGPPSPRAWSTLSLLSGEELALWGGARSLVDWHARHRFCARCGSATQLAKGGWQRDCTAQACGAEHFPRVDPVTIMLVQHGEGAAARLLLGRQPRFPPGRFSALAGFVEPGESIEEAVAREVFEEAGVKVRDVAYIASQPWPFPSSLMIGCIAYADDDALVVDKTELEEARWFSRVEIADAMAHPPGEGSAFAAPPPVAIANRLLAWWLDQSIVQNIAQ